MKHITRVDLRHPNPTRNKGIIYVINLNWWATPIVLPILKVWIELTKLYQNKDKHIWGKWKN